MPTVRIALPATLDAVSCRALEQALRSETEPSEGGVLVLHGEEGVFCRGLELGGLADDPEGLSRGMDAFGSCLEAILASERPVVAVVDGPALGGGFGIAAACDVVIATENARFGLPEGMFGLAPESVFGVIAGRLAPQRVALLALTLHARPARDPLLRGLVDELVDADGLQRSVGRWARELSRCPAEAVRAIKRLRSEHQPPLGIHEGGRRTVAALADPDVRARIERFVTGDTPW